MGKCGKCGEPLTGTRCWSCVTTMLGRNGTVLAVPLAEMEHLSPGTVLEGKWRVERLIGRGGMGLVYEAFDLALERPVAVKVMAENLLADEAALSSFEREAKLTARLSHPNIVTVHAVGRHLHRPFIVMEYLEGESLAQTMKTAGGRLGVRRAVEVTRQVCAGLQFVHERGCVHRDVKPTNIFVGREGHATLLDFGILVDLGNGSPFAGAPLMGTPGYIAPEVVLHEASDARSDVYAMGAVIYRMLAGTSPWGAPSRDEVTLDDLLRPPKSLAVASPDLPKELCWVVMKSLAREPGLRYSTAKALSDALESAAAGIPVGSPLPSLPVPADARPLTQRLDGVPQKRSRRALGAGLLVGGLAVLAATGVVRWRLSMKSEAPGVVTPPVPGPMPEPSPPPLASIPEPPRQESAPIKEPTPKAVSPPPRNRVVRQPVRNEKLGKLRVVSVEKGQPTWANVAVDGQPRGGTPTMDMELRAGAHRLSVTRDGFKRVEKSVTIEAGALSLERIELIPVQP